MTIGTTHCIQCEAEAPLDSEGRCDFCSIESTEEEHEANNFALGSGGKRLREERVYTLDREETVSVTYSVRARSLDEAVMALHGYDEERIIQRDEDDVGELGDVRYLGRDSRWHYPDWGTGKRTPPLTKEVPRG